MGFFDRISLRVGPLYFKRKVRSYRRPPIGGKVRQVERVADAGRWLIEGGVPIDEVTEAILPHEIGHLRSTCGPVGVSAINQRTAIGFYLPQLGGRALVMRRAGMELQLVDDQPLKLVQESLAQASRYGQEPSRVDRRSLRKAEKWEQRKRD